MAVYEHWEKTIQKVKHNSVDHRRWCRAMASGGWQRVVQKSFDVLLCHEGLLSLGFGADYPPLPEDPLADEERMACEVASLWCHVAGEYSWAFSAHQFQYPERFALLLVNDANFERRLAETRAHFDLVLKYEKAALDDERIAAHLGRITFLHVRTIRLSWMLWSAAATTSWADQDPRAFELNNARFAGLGDTLTNEVSNKFLRQTEQTGGERKHINAATAGCMRRLHHGVICSTALDQRKVSVVTPDWDDCLRSESGLKDRRVKPTRPAGCPPEPTASRAGPEGSRGCGGEWGRGAGGGEFGKVCERATV